VQFKPNLTVLDLGCGLGFPLIEMAMRLGHTARLYGIDPWQAALNRAVLKIQKLQLSQVIVVQGLGEALPFPENSFDLIFSNNGINNVQDLARTLNECARVAKPGAQFVATLNLDQTMHEFYEAFEAVLRDYCRLDVIAAMREHIYQKRRPIFEIMQLLHAAGFQVNTIENEEFELRFLDGSAFFRHFLIYSAFLESWKNLVDPVWQHEIFVALETRLNDLAKVNGELKMTIPFAIIDSERCG
jgi:ubiquinone/menaquinone biosynthesis C-methylase UbiE